MDDPLRQLTDALINELQERREAGEMTVPIAPGLARELAAAPPPRSPAPLPARGPTTAGAAPAPAAESAAPGTGQAAQPPRFAGMDWPELRREALACRRCPLAEGRGLVVFGQGALDAELMFVGEGPGQQEDRLGIPFVGPAGELLSRILNAMAMSRDEVYIANAVKCRPPGNRVPEPEEMQTCWPFLERQIELVRPRVLVCLGATAVKALLQPRSLSIGSLRGNWQLYRGIDVMPTWHPAYLLRNPAAKRDVWSDMKQVLQRLGRPVPKGGD